MQRCWSCAAKTSPSRPQWLTCRRFSSLFSLLFLFLLHPSPHVAVRNSSCLVRSALIWLVSSTRARWSWVVFAKSGTSCASGRVSALTTCSDPPSSCRLGSMPLFLCPLFSLFLSLSHCLSLSPSPLTNFQKREDQRETCCVYPAASARGPGARQYQGLRGEPGARKAAVHHAQLGLQQQRGLSADGEPASRADQRQGRAAALAGQVSACSGGGGPLACQARRGAREVVVSHPSLLSFRTRTLSSSSPSLVPLHPNPGHGSCSSRRTTGAASTLGWTTKSTICGSR